MYKVVFLNLKTGTRVEKEFNSPYLCRKFLNKARRSKEITIVSEPLFSY